MATQLSGHEHFFSSLDARDIDHPRNGKLVDAANRRAGWETNRWTLAGQECALDWILVRKSPYCFLIECQFAESFCLHGCNISCGYIDTTGGIILSLRAEFY